MNLDIKLSPTLVAHVDGEDIKVMIARAAFFQGLPRQCPRCGTALHFTYRNVPDPQDNRKMYDYYGLSCETPYPNQHSVTFGQNNDKGHSVGLFLSYKENFLTMDEAKAASAAKKAGNTGGFNQNPYQQGNGAPLQYATQAPQQAYNAQPVQQWASGVPQGQGHAPAWQGQPNAPQPPPAPGFPDDEDLKF